MRNTRTAKPRTAKPKAETKWELPTDSRARWLLTLGNREQVESTVRGRFLRGQAEPRLAFVGRSNVGKSTLLNALAGASLAQISAQPGKTRLLHFYLWTEAGKILADLPGYGFAKASRSERERWSGFIQDYLEKDSGLERAVVLLDSRHGPTELDEEAIRFIDGLGLPVTFVMTKADQLSTQSERARRKKEVEAAVLRLGHDPSAVFWVSVRDAASMRVLRRLLAERLRAGEVAQAAPAEALNKESKIKDSEEE
jgi:GTP-binding protein